jgi:hypothetical protein
MASSKLRAAKIQMTRVKTMPDRTTACFLSWSAKIPKFLKNCKIEVAASLFLGSSSAI